MSETSATYRTIYFDHKPPNGSWSEEQKPDLTEVHDLIEEGWEVVEFSYDKHGCFQGAMMVKHDE